MATPAAAPEIELPVQQQQPLESDSAQSEPRVPKALKIYRLPNYIKPDHGHFKAMELRLGLHTHGSLVTAHGDMDSFKVQVVQRMTQTKAGVDPMGSAKWTDFVSEVSQEDDADALYETAPPPDPTRILPGRREVLALDALFLCVYLCHVSGKLSDLKLVGECEEVFGDTEFEARRFPLYRDLMVMGNQLPMSLVLAVMKQLISAGNLRDNNCSHETQQSGEEEQQQLLGRGNDQHGAETMLNDVLIHVAGIVHPFAHGDKYLCSRSRWKKKLKEHMEAHHKPVVQLKDGSWKWLPDGLWKCPHILASTYLAICGGHNPQPEDEERKWWWSRCWCGQQQQEEDLEDNVNELPTASDLKLCGIKFNAVDRPYRLDTVAFKNHTLMLPKLVMDDHTASLFRNLALYEQVENSKNAYRSDFRSYLHLMASLIHSPEDVRLLVRSGVLVNHLGSEEAVSKEWNTMCEGLFLTVSQYRKLQKQIDAHMRAQHNQWFADFRARNCQNPLHALAWVAVCVVTVATVAQTVMAFVAYYLPRG